MARRRIIHEAEGNGGPHAQFVERHLADKIDPNGVILRSVPEGCGLGS